MSEKKGLSVRDELRHKYPGRASKADHGRSAMSALRLNCAECMGGNAHLVRSCDTYDCFLWPYRANKVDLDERPEGKVPSLDEYAEMLSEWWESRGLDKEAAAERLRAAREGSDDADSD